MTPGGASVLLPNEAALQQMLAEATTFSPRAVEREAVLVEVQNGTNVDSLDALSASRLNYAGYQTHISAADSHDYTASILVDLTSAQDPNRGFALLNALGLSNSASQISLPDPNSTVQYRLIVGYDYEPCFQPEQLSH
jgi:hypothetical protein